MCGITGYLGPAGAITCVLNGLQKLEYRGYDSAGVAFHNPAKGRIDIIRVAGRVAALKEKAAASEDSSKIAIGHTRWATHGVPSIQNAHPHRGGQGEIALVHNGIIENHEALRTELIEAGFEFQSQTDTEVAAHLMAHLYDGDLVKAVESTAKRIIGTFAFAVLSPNHPDMLVGARRGSPLAVGLGEGEYILASDAVPIVAHTRKVVYLEDDQIVVLRPNGIEVRQDGKSCPLRPIEIQWDPQEAERDGFEHFMLKEIHEQPAALRTLASKLIGDPGDAQSFPTFNLDELKLSREQLLGISRIVMLGQGTAYHAAMIGRNMLERITKLPVQVEYGSDFRYRNPILDPSVLVIAISQSGETADTLGAVRLARKRGCLALSVINAEGSTIARECDGVAYMHVGPEIGVASTKAFTGQISALYVVAIHLGIVKGSIDIQEATRRISDLRQVPIRVEEALEHADEIKAIALKYKDADNFLYLGRGTGYPLALEGALKLKEVSYIHAEGLDAGEMKHGPIALIDENMPAVILALKGRRYDKILSNIQEVKARGGQVIAIASHDDDKIGDLVDDVIPVHDDRGIMNSIVCSIPLQLIAYYIAVARGCDVDKPRNLAKSVTVE